MDTSQTSLNHNPAYSRHCKQCDAEVASRARFCSACGAVVEPADSSPLITQEPEVHDRVRRWQSIGISISSKKQTEGASSSADNTPSEEVIKAAEQPICDAVQEMDSSVIEDSDEEAEEDKSYTQPHLAAVIANIGRRQAPPVSATSTPAVEERLSETDKAYAIEGYDTMTLSSYAPVPKPSSYELSTERSVAIQAPVEKPSYSAMPQLAEALDLRQTQTMPVVRTVGRKAASIAVEARETQRLPDPAPAQADRASTVWPFILIIAALATVLVVYGLPGLSIRPYVVLVFLILCPGMALIRLLRLRDVAVEWTLAIALSITIDAIIPTIQLYAHVWSPNISLAIILGITIIAALAQFIEWRPRAVKKVKPA